MADNEPIEAPAAAGGLDISTPLGLAMAFFCLLFAFYMEKTCLGRLPDGFLAPFGALISISAAFIVIGGTFAAAFISFPMPVVMRLLTGALFRNAIKKAPEGGPEMVS